MSRLPEPPSTSPEEEDAEVTGLQAAISCHVAPLHSLKNQLINTFRRLVDNEPSSVDVQKNPPNFSRFRVFVARLVFQDLQQSKRRRRAARGSDVTAGPERGRRFKAPDPSGPPLPSHPPPRESLWFISVPKAARNPIQPSVAAAG